MNAAYRSAPRLRLSTEIAATPAPTLPIRGQSIAYYSCGYALSSLRLLQRLVVDMRGGCDFCFSSLILTSVFLRSFLLQQLSGLRVGSAYAAQSRSHHNYHSPAFAGAGDVAIRYLGFFFGKWYRGFRKLLFFCFFAACRDLINSEPRQREAPLCSQKCKKARQKTQGKPLLGVLCSRPSF